MNVQQVLLCSSHRKPRPSGVSLASPGLENIIQVPRNGVKVGQNHDAPEGVSATLLVLKESGGYNSAQKLEGERSKSFAVFISRQTKAIKSWFRVPGTGN